MNSSLLARIHREALAALDPSRLVARWLLESSTRFGSVIAIGKCSGPMLDGAWSYLAADTGDLPPKCFAAIPRSYPLPKTARCDIHVGSHPEPDDSSLRAGDALLRFIEGVDAPSLVLLSGGGSAVIDVIDEELIERSRWLKLQRTILRSGTPIETMNLARAAVSKLKGGGLAAMLPEGSVALILSDVDPDHPESVASGPTWPPPELEMMRRALAIFGVDVTPRPKPDSTPMRNIVLADNITLLETAAAIGSAHFRQVVVEKLQLREDVEAVARRLVEMAPSSRETLLVAGGEPVVKVVGDGIGGRGSELALRILGRLRESPGEGLEMLIGSTDGVDGSSPAGAYVIRSADGGKINGDEFAQALESSNSYPLVARCAETIIMKPTGNNLRDLFLVARA